MTVKKQENPELLSLITDQVMDDHLASLRYAGMIQHALIPDPEDNGIIHFSSRISLKYPGENM